MSEAVLYMNRGTKCYPRLLTSILSLRKHYQGNIVLLQEGELHSIIANVLSKFNVEVRPIPNSTDRILIRKSSIWREIKEDHVMYLDSDTIVREPIDDFFGWVKEKGFVATWFTEWATTGMPVRTRIEEWSKVVPDLIRPALEYRKAINSGVQGWSKNASILPAYELLTRQGADAGCNRLVLDEIALQLLLPRYPHYLAHHVWNTSAVYGNISKAKIVHYHGKKHCKPASERCDLWKQHYFELLASFPEHAVELGKHWGDRRLKRFVTDINHRRRDVTVVAVVDPNGADQFEHKFQAWLELRGINKQRFLVFINDSKLAQKLHFLNNHRNVKVVHWNYIKRLGNSEDFKFSAFIFGVAKHIKTAYWMKLNIDNAPRRNWWEWPDYITHSITGHSWCFSYVKNGTDSLQGDIQNPDKSFSSKQPYFKRIIDPMEHWINCCPTISHDLPTPDPFCHIEQTDFTRRIAFFLKQKNKKERPTMLQGMIDWYRSLFGN
jgi:hypothetical protein